MPLEFTAPVAGHPVNAEKDVSALRIHLNLTTVGPVNPDGTPVSGAKCIVTTAGYSCVDHPGWKGDAWPNALEHLEEHGDKPFESAARVSEHVQVGVEPPSS